MKKKPTFDELLNKYQNSADQKQNNGFEGSKTKTLHHQG